MHRNNEGEGNESTVRAFTGLARSGKVKPAAERAKLEPAEQNGRR